MAYTRPQAATLARRLAEPRRFIQVVAGPRQVGKTTLVQQVLDASHRVAGALRQRGRADVARIGVDRAAVGGCAPGGCRRREVRRSAGAGRDPEDSRLVGNGQASVGRGHAGQRVPCSVVLLGSAPLLIARGLAESLAGRFEVLHLPHWSLTEMRAAFGWSLGPVPVLRRLSGRGAADQRARALGALHPGRADRDHDLRATCCCSSRVDKPALLRRLFELACRYSGQILSYTKMLGQLQDAGNTTTLAHYLELAGGGRA